MKRVTLTVVFILLAVANHAYALIPPPPFSFYVDVKYADGEKEKGEFVLDRRELDLPSGAQIYVVDFDKEHYHTTIFFFPPNSTEGHELFLPFNLRRPLAFEDLKGKICLKRNHNSRPGILW